MFSSKFLHSYISIYLQAGLRQQITKWFYNHTHSIKKSLGDIKKRKKEDDSDGTSATPQTSDDEATLKAH